MGLIREIGDGPLALDTVVFIYFIEEHPRFLPLLDPVFAAIDGERLPAIASSLTLLEVLVVPYRVGNVPLAERYELVLTRSRGLRLVDIDRTQLRAAAQLRAVHSSLRTPDAVQISAALSGGCSVLLTNDRELPAVPGLRILQLRDFAT
ncbi:MAG TPA: PIN domain-containing protein [Thermoanaerobaculia bacterium]|nr:PIN domain-containing protein [Thermoanaerobaculia bacterium]